MSRKSRPPCGSPACAGIDPPRRPRCPRPPGLPRVRGDRPHPARSRQTPQPAPPRARGSTCVAQARRRAGRGSPACAGIDPAALAPHQPPRRLPRVRGDRPSFRRRRSTSTRAPPRARGSTRCCRLRPRTARGSPACAGIDRPRRAGLPRGRGLPRVRGDRPVCSCAIPSQTVAPPRARGSTPCGRPRVRRPRGSPACAGIDRTGPPPRWPPPRLPRVRGDRPAADRSKARRTLAPPRARGSTPRRRGPDGERGGSPACAGIDPLSGPTKDFRERLPRVRGDRPVEYQSVWDAIQAPPRARGSTEARQHRWVGDRGSPACAGIDLLGLPGVMR